ncbi:MAG: PilW family protein [Deltaproteobacteria bacterium]|jgi:type II secretory pathway pseudopilin PulG|nr:PilW family protein [Deltaproteobacteria bacterium]
MNDIKLKQAAAQCGPHTLRPLGQLKAQVFKALALLNRRRSAMTLIELLTVVFLGSLLMSMVFMLYSSSSRSFMRQESVLEQMLNLRSGISGVSRDLRMAGNGFSLLGLNQNQFLQVYNKNEDGSGSSWFKYESGSDFGVKPIFSIDGSQAPDSLTICSLAPDFAAPLGMLETGFTSSSDSLKLSEVLTFPAGLDDEVLKSGDYLALVPASGSPILVQATSDGSNLTDIDIAPLPSGTLPNGVTEIGAGSLVYNVKSVRLHTFRVNTTDNTLVMDSDEAEGDILAEDIEDFQVAFCLGDDDPSNLANYVHDLSGQDLLSRPVKAVRIVVISRSPREDPYKGNHLPIPALNHTVVGGPDNYVRRLLETTIQLRNY